MSDDRHTADAALIAEARRQVDNLREIYADLMDTRDSLLAEQRTGGLHAYMLPVFNSAAVHLLALGQAAYVLDGKPDVARAAFGDLSQWIPYFDASVAARLVGEAPSPLQERQLFDPAICFLLARDRDSLGHLAAIDFARVFDTRPHPVKVGRAWCDFVRNLLDVAAGRTHAAIARGQTPVRPGDVIEGYDAMLLAIARCDGAAFEKARVAAAAAYPARGKKREAAVNWFGEGKVAQAATFDALGTALCQLARWRGLDVRGDARLHPETLLDRR